MGCVGGLVRDVPRGVELGGAMRTYLDVPGWFDFQDIYDEAVTAAPWTASVTGARFVEVGVAFGRSAIYMADAIRASRKRIAFDTIDSWRPEHVPGDEKLRELAEAFGGVREVFAWYARECRVREFLNIVQADSVAAASGYVSGSLDLVFLDSSHQYKETCAEIAAWLPKVRPGGVFAGHDFTPAWPGVVRAVGEMLPGAVRRRSSFFWRVPGA